ncbi:MAG: hypothetical protein AAF488_05515 [Planctomycetota bacterium]
MTQPLPASSDEELSVPPRPDESAPSGPRIPAWVWGVAGLILGGLIGGYFWSYVQTPMVDLPSEGPPVRVRFFEDPWAGTVWKPAAAVESLMLGREVELIAGSPFEDSPTN